MSKFDLISFDLQGTLSDSRFSDEFWLELLPELYARHHKISPGTAKEQLKVQFSTMGKYDERYYCASYWLKLLCPSKSFQQMTNLLKTQPLLFPDTLRLVEEWHKHKKIPLIIISTTSRDFINVELGGSSCHFKAVYSTLDDLQIAGKPPRVFTELAAKFAVKPERLLHIGDCPEMDVKNAELAGWQAFYFDKKQPREKILAELQKFVAE